MWSIILAWLSKMSFKVWGVVITVLAVLAWLFKFKRDAEQRGAEKVKTAVRKETDRVKEKWDEIDRTDPDLDAALNGLQRSRRPD